MSLVLLFYLLLQCLITPPLLTRVSSLSFLLFRTILSPVTCGSPLKTALSLSNLILLPWPLTCSAVVCVWHLYILSSVIWTFSSVLAFLLLFFLPFYSPCMANPSTSDILAIPLYTYAYTYSCTCTGLNTKQSHRCTSQFVIWGHLSIQETVLIMYSCLILLLNTGHAMVKLSNSVVLAVIYTAVPLVRLGEMLLPGHPLLTIDQTVCTH